jgi:phage baseplate assembly protein W
MVQIIKLLIQIHGATNQSAISISLNNIFKLRPGELILEPSFGNELYRFLYEPMNKYTVDKIVKTIKQMIEKWEPRIIVIDVPITAYEEDVSYGIQVIYYIPELNANGEYNFTLAR